jgi:hypothetical protein
VSAVRTSEEAQVRRPARFLGDRSFLALLVILLAATPVLLHAGRAQWFALDEWDFILDRDLARPGTLLESWTGHNVFLPAVAYRVLFEVWGISSYRPYQLLGIASHYAVVLTVWAMSRRVGVRGWIATAVVAPLVVLGAGRVNILFGFQVTMTAALSLSLLHLLLADHGGPWSRRDTAGLLCGAAALLCSGVAVAGTIGVGAAMLIRRGPRVALAHTAPLGLAWSIWYSQAPRRGSTSTTVLDGETLRFLVGLPKAGLGGLGRLEPIAFALGAIAVLGVVATVWSARRAPDGRAWRVQLAGLAGCLVTLTSFGVLNASQRLGTSVVRDPTESRYVYVVAALVIPLVALGTEVIARHRRPLVLVPLALLAVGLPAHIRSLDDRSFAFRLDDPDLLVALANSELLASAPPGVITGLRTTDDLRRMAALPGMPDDDGVSRELQLQADLMLGLHPAPRDLSPDCALVARDRRRLDAGDTIDFDGSVTVTAVEGTDRSTAMTFDDERGGRLIASGPLTVEVSRTPYSGAQSGVYDCSPGD